MKHPDGLLFPDNDQIITPKIAGKIEKGTYERPEGKALSFCVSEGSSVVELGAGIGFVSALASRVYKAGRVTCIEANPALCRYIEAVHAENGVAGSTVINAVALGLEDAKSTKTVPFFVTDPFWSSSMVKPSKGVVEEIEVPVVSLSKVLADVKADTLIVDIEGGEVTLFDDVDLSPVQFVLMELHTRKTGPRGIVRVFENMHRHGFFYHQRASGDGVVLFKRYQAAV